MKLKTKHDIIENFIQQFRQFGTDVVDCFSCGMCFHFAWILKARFGPGPEVVYDPVINHFACRIDDRIYDISGDITDNTEYKWETWATFKGKDQKETMRIVRDCVWKIPDGVLVCGICPMCFEDDWGNYICDLDNSPVDPDQPCTKGGIVTDGR